MLQGNILANGNVENSNNGNKNSACIEQEFKKNVRRESIVISFLVSFFSSLLVAIMCHFFL